MSEVAVIDQESMAALDTLDTGSREIAITQMLSRAKDYLAVALHQSDAPRAVADFKAEIIAVAQYAKQKRMSEEIQIDATAMVRRTERALGVAIRDGQGRGEIGKRGDDTRTDLRDPLRDAKKVSPSTYFISGQETYETYAMADDVTDDVFDAALDAAKDERNLSRANVVRKIKEAKDEAPQMEKPKMDGSGRRAMSGPRKRDSNILANINLGLNGYVAALDQMIRTGLDDSITAEEAGTLHADLSRSIKELNTIARMLKTRKES